jgi:energy-coupling factor transport system ATP-binding protein
VATATSTPRGGRVEVRDLTWRPYGRRDPIIDGFDLDLAPGQRLLLVGPSGSGKSTLLRALAGALETTASGDLSGAVTIDGAAPGDRPGAVGLVLQEPGAGVVSATIGRDVAFGLENIGMPRGDMPARVTAALAAVRLELPQDTPTHALSGGEQQRLALAGALALEPSLLLLDEPTAMLDPVNAASVRDSVEQVVTGRQLTTVVVEHKLGPWVSFADRILVLDGDGRVVVDGDPATVLAQHGESLAAQGIWVPGVPAPQPRGIPAGVFTPSDIGANVVALAAHDVTVGRTVRRLNGSTRRSLAVADQSFEARAGQTHALVGPSGAGKSTLMLALAGLLDHDSGTVAAHADLVPGHRAPAADGRDPRTWSTTEVAGLVAWVPQWASSTIVAGTVLEEVMTTARALGQVEDEALARARALLDLVGLGHLEQADPRHLSGGEQRRLAMVSAVVHQPEVLLADEATVGQDRLTWAAVLGIVEAMRDRGSAVVLTTHDDAVVDRADRTTAVTRPVQPPDPPAPRRPLVARCGPLALLGAAALAIPAGIIPTHWSVSLAVLGVQLLLAVVGLWAPGRGPAPPGRVTGTLVRMVPGAIGAVSVAWSTWLLGPRDLEVSATAGLRVLIIVFPSAVLIRHVDADALADHLGQLLKVPARLAVAVGAALQRVHTFGDIWAELGRARRVRGIAARASSPRSVLLQLWAMTLGMLVRSLQTAAELAVAMDARGFATARRRTWASRAAWTRSDVLLVLASCLPLAVAVAGSR